MNRSIIHLNVADFAVAVERMSDAGLTGRPVIIAAEGAARAGVYDMSEEAYCAGIRKGMPLGRAIRLCKNARVLPLRLDRYERAMKALFKHALPYSPCIETGDDDGHLFVDVTGVRRLFGPAVDIARRLYREIKTDLCLDPIWSVAPNKLVAKVATRVVKPTGEYIVRTGQEENFLAPLPVALIPGVDSNDMHRLMEFNLTRVSQVTALGLTYLKMPFGTRARFLYDILRGIDPSPVLSVGQKPPRVIVDREFGDDTNTVSTLEGALYSLVEAAGRRLRKQNRVARRMGVAIGYSDGRRCVRQASVAPATANDLSLFESARCAFYRAWIRRVRVRHLRLICDRLTFPPAQLALFPLDRKQNEKRDNLISAIDRIRSRFGRDVIRMGRTLKDERREHRTSNIE